MMRTHARPVFTLMRHKPIKILAAAILDAKGEVCSLPIPARHHDIIAMMVQQGHATPITGEQGFILDNGAFADRVVAANVAVAAGQIEKPKWPPKLYSEDLW